MKLSNLKRKLIGLACAVGVIVGSIEGSDIIQSEGSGGLSDFQQEYADTIASTVAENWDTYGCLPSVAVAQAFIESSLGVHCAGYNCWGIRSGAVHYASLEEGIFAYMKVINNGYYDGAPFNKDYEDQLRAILDGGYCEPEGPYYRLAISSINKYGWDQYDQEMFEDIEEQKKLEEKALEEKKKQEKREAQLEKQQHKFKVVYDPDKVPNDWTIAICDTMVEEDGCMFLYDLHNRYRGIYDMITYDNDGEDSYVIYTATKKYDGVKTYIQPIEGAKG